MEYLIRGETLAGIAAEVKRLCEIEGLMTPDEMKEALAAVEAGGGSSETIKGMIDGTLTELKAEDFESVTAIRQYAFYQQTSLENVDIPDSVISIDANSFNGCTAIESLKMPYATLISNGSFSKCSNIQTLILTPGTGTITEYNYTTVQQTPWWISKSKIKSVILCEGITRIGNHLFRELSALESIVIPKGVTELGTYAFHSSGLKSITIPKSLTKIGGNCFYSCDITDVYYEGTEEEWSAIEIDSDNACITANYATIHYNTPM